MAPQSDQPNSDHVELFAAFWPRLRELLEVDAHGGTREESFMRATSKLLANPGRLAGLLPKETTVEMARRMSPPVSLERYMRTAMRSAVVDAVRHQRRFSVQPEKAETESRDVVAAPHVGEDVVLHEVARLRESQSAVRQAIRELPARKQLLLRLRLVRGLEFQDISRELGVNADAVRVECSRLLHDMATNHMCDPKDIPWIVHDELSRHAQTSPRVEPKVVCDAGINEEASFRSALAKRLRLARDQQGMKQEGAARLMGVSVATYSRWEQGHFSPSAFFLKRLALVLGVSIDWLCGVSTHESPPSSSGVGEVGGQGVTRGLGGTSPYFSWLGRGSEPDAQAREVESE